MPKKQTALRSAFISVTTYTWLAVAATVLLSSLLLYHERHTNFVLDAVTRRPQPYTELYFTNAARLPADISSGQSLPVDFAIHNVEGRPTTYTYTISFTTVTGRTTVLTRRTLTLTAGAKQFVNMNAQPLAGYRGRGEVSVTLLHQPEAIHYWAEVSS